MKIELSDEQIKYLIDLIDRSIKRSYIDEDNISYHGYHSAKYTLDRNNLRQFKNVIERAADPTAPANN